MNLALVAVIYLALAFGPGAGLMAGTVGGLVQDALAGGIVGVGGFAKTLVGFMVGVLGRPVHRRHSLPRLVMFVCGTLMHELCYQALYAIVEARTFRMHWSAALIQAAVNGLIGVLAFAVVESGPGTAAAPARKGCYPKSTALLRFHGRRAGESVGRKAAGTGQAGGSVCRPSPALRPSGLELRPSDPIHRHDHDAATT